MKLKTTPFKYVLPMMLLYSLVSLWGILHHELFLEEAQQLTIGRDSNSVAGVFTNMLYEGHVTLWNTFLFFIAHYISPRPVYMQLFHLLIINSAVFVFLRYAPFSLPVKILIVFGCYFLFVYGQISRNYALGILLLFVCCVLLANPAKKMITLGILVVLMCFTHLFYVFAAAGIFIYLFCCTFGNRKLYGRFAVFTCLFLFGAISAFLQSRRIPADSIVQVAPGLSWLNAPHLFWGISGFARGYITVPPLYQPYFWDKQAIQYLPHAGIVIISIALFTITLLFIYKSRKALLFYIIPVGLLLVFLSMSGLAGSRYFGMFFIFFIAALWLARYDGVMLFTSNSTGFKKWGPQVFIYLLLANQFFTDLYMYVADIRHPFSQAKNTIAYLKNKHLDSLPLAFDGYNAGPPLSAYWGKKIFYLDINQYGSFCIWKKDYLPFPRKTLADEIIASPYINRLREFILITNRPLASTTDEAYHFSKLTNFDGAIIQGEDYAVYRCTKK